ncbi:MAG: T9SS type A sorting domain-containing protein [Tannerella sp.]|jgi:hypothetical protein|nr:T9SS type A sorting domain-containing protein [Tannerella sp.]
MKKYLLLLLVFPCLLTAQVSKDGIKGTPFRWLNKLQTANEVMSRAESIDNLPDSTYTYYDGELHRRVHITYNEEGWVVQEKGYTDFSRSGIVDDDFKREYTYKREDNFLVQEAITFLTPYQEGVWYEFSGEVIYYNANGLPVKSYAYYPDDKGGWELNSLSATVEYNGKGNPSVVVDSVPGVGGLTAYMRYEITYDGQGRIAGYNTFFPDRTGEWKPYERIEVTYDSRGNRLDNYLELGENGEWISAYVVETLYDERGNICSEAVKKLGEDGKYYTVREDTYRHVYMPDGWTVAVVEPSRSSVVYPNPSVDYVTVLLQDANEAVVTLTNISGRTVSRQSVERQATIAVHSLPPGMYLLTVKTAAKTDVHKLIVK